MLSGYAVRQQLICMLNRQRRASYHYKEFQAIQKDLYDTYGLLYELSIWTLPSLNFPTAWIMDKDSPSPYLKFGDIPWSGLERHGYHPRLFQPGLFHNEFETWSFLFDLQTSNRHPYRLPDLNSKTDEERAERNRETLFHYDPIKSYGTRARSIYDALNVGPILGAPPSKFSRHIVLILHRVILCCPYYKIMEKTEYTLST